MSLRSDILIIISGYPVSSSRIVITTKGTKRAKKRPSVLSFLRGGNFTGSCQLDLFLDPHNFILKSNCRRQTSIIHYSFDIIHSGTVAVFQLTLTGGFKGTAP